MLQISIDIFRIDILETLCFRLLYLTTTTILVNQWSVVDGDADVAVEARMQNGWNTFQQLLPLFTNRDTSLIRRGRLYSSCVRCSTLHISETWPVRKENEVALQQAEMRIVRWMCNVKGDMQRFFTKLMKK